MTITISKAKFALAVFAIAMIAPATALATHVFDDVDDSRFYAVPVEWAFENDITTGKTPTSFAPDDPVTRGESVTFLKRYNDNVVEAADATLQTGIDDNGSDIADNADDIDALRTIEGILTAPFSGDGTALEVPGFGSFALTSCNGDGTAAKITWTSPGADYDINGVYLSTGVAIANGTFDSTATFPDGGSSMTLPTGSVRVQLHNGDGDIATATLGGLTPDGSCRAMIQVVP